MPNHTEMMPIRPRAVVAPEPFHPAAEGLGMLTVLEGGDVGYRFGLRAQRRAHLLGRSVRCDVPLPHAKVSRHHARIFFEVDPASGGWKARVVDLGSTNGTWLNGDAIHDARLASGDELLVGSVRLGVELYADAAAAERMRAAPEARRLVREPHAARRMDLRFRELGVVANRMRLDHGHFCVGVLHLGHLGALRKSLGEQVGAKLVEAAAAAAARSLRSCDVVARSHADEVLLVVECAHLQGGHRAAARSLQSVRHAAQAMCALAGERRTHEIAPSMGLALSGSEPFAASVQRARDALVTALAVDGSSIVADPQVVYVH